MSETIPTDALRKEIAALDADIKAHSHEKEEFSRKIDLQIAAKQIARDRLAKVLASGSEEAGPQNPGATPDATPSRFYEEEGNPVKLLRATYASARNEEELIRGGAKRDAARRAIHRLVEERKHLAKKNGNLEITDAGKSAWEASPLFTK